MNPEEAYLRILNLTEGQTIFQSWRESTPVVSCPFCGAGFLPGEQRPQLLCEYCQGDYVKAKRYSDWLNVVLTADQGQYYAQLSQGVRERLAHVTHNSYYGFEMGARNRHLDKDQSK